MKRYLTFKESVTAERPKISVRVPFYDFVHCRGKRFISLVSCDFTEKHYKKENGEEAEADEDDGKITLIIRTPQHISMHSSIVQSDKFNDCFVDFVNRVRDKRKKFEQFYPDETIEIWFKNSDGADLHKTNDVTICLLCEWHLSE